MDEKPDAVTAFEAQEMACAAIKQIWKRRLGKPLFPAFYAFEDQSVYAFGYTTKQWNGDGPRYVYPGAFVPVIDKRDGSLQLEPSGPDFHGRHPDLTRIPDSKLIGPIPWKIKPAERLGLAGKQITPYEGLQVVRSVVERSWRRRWGRLMFPDDYASEFDDFYAFGYDAKEAIEDNDERYIRYGTVKALVRKRDGALYFCRYPLPLSMLFPGQERPIPPELLRAP